MDREYVFLVLVSALAGPMTLALALLPPKKSSDLDLQYREARHWHRLWFPLAPIAGVLVAALGWALVEPDDSESLPSLVVIMAALSGLIMIRATVRALFALVRPAIVSSAAAVGLLRPRIVISPRFVAAVDTDALDAARKHEAAHVHHRDPLRFWLGQWAADMQWPSPHGRTRLRAWMQALEIARDDEARRAGADGDDLAAAILTAVRLSPESMQSGVVALGQDDADLGDRIGRLMRPLGDADSRRSPWRVSATAWLVALFAAFAIGIVQGEHAVRALAGFAP